MDDTKPMPGRPTLAGSGVAVGLARAWRWFLVAVACGLAACVAPPERQPVKETVALPKAFAALPAAARNAEVSAWLASFHDADVNALVTVALAANNDLRATAARIDQARALARIEGADARPQLAFPPAFQHVGGGRRTRDLVNEGNVLTLPFELTWEVDVWGRIADARRAAELSADAAEADWRAAKLSLAARTARTCFELAEARQRVEVVQTSVKDRGVLAELLQGRFNLGLAVGLDLSLALTDLSDARAELNDAANDVQQAQRRLELLLGRYPAGTLARCQKMPGLPAPIPVGLPAELLSRRPDIVAAFARLRSQDRRLSGARKALLPRLTLLADGGSLGRTWSDLADPGSVAWNVILGLTQPVYAGGRLRADIDLQAAHSEEALHQYRETVLDAFREVEQSLAAEQWLRKREQEAAAIVKQNNISRELAIYSYRNSVVGILTLLDSYRMTLFAETLLLEAQLHMLNNRLDLYLALGGGI